MCLTLIANPVGITEIFYLYNDRLEIIYLKCCVLGWVVGKSPIDYSRFLGLWGVPSVGVILRDPRPYLRKFQRKPLKTLNG